MAAVAMRWIALWLGEELVRLDFSVAARGLASHLIWIKAPPR